MSGVIETLIDLGALAKDSLVTARKGTLNRFGIMIYTSDDYMLQGISNLEQGLSLALKQADGQEEIMASVADITAIDGMSVARYAEIYNINPDGSLKSMGRKRGRKPKIKLTAI